MRYCACTLIFALFAAAVGCQGPLVHRFGGMHSAPTACAGGAVPSYFADAMQQESMNGLPSQETTQVHFIGPEGMMVNYESESIPCPGVHNFQQGAIYRLKLSNIPNGLGRELYPTLEVYPTFARTQAFLNHNMVPVEFTDNDFDQVMSGNFITKVVYLPNPEFQSLATAGVGTLVNTQLEPGVDPLVEAQNRGAILAVVRIGNKDLSVPETVPMEINGTNGATPGAQFEVNPAFGSIPNPPMMHSAIPAPKTHVRSHPLVAPPQPTIQ